MNNPLDAFGTKVRKEREVRDLTQKQLAAKLGMSHRTVMQAEICRSNPKFETVVLLAQELNISLDALIFPETTSPNQLPKCVYDYFKDKTEAEAQKLIDLCRQIEAVNDDH
ncbi:helix-turn-helix domain-containing protein [Intestinimonas sp. HCP28S3_D6]|uniref:helix-turn-helix domain-containing protein n=1 Tax=Intestinimonas sp. HCP28S3_D6 TaxID=3438942 RepID=UPI003F8B7445